MGWVPPSLPSKEVLEKMRDEGWLDEFLKGEQRTLKRMSSGPVPVVTILAVLFASAMAVAACVQWAFILGVL